MNASTRRSVRSASLLAAWISASFATGVVRADDTHFAVPADLGAPPSAGVTERVVGAGAAIGTENSIIGAYLDEKGGSDDRVPRVGGQWRSDPEAATAVPPATGHRVVAISFAAPGVAIGFPFEDGTDNPGGPVSVSGKLALFYRITNTAKGIVSAQVDLAGIEGERPTARLGGWSRSWSPDEYVQRGEVADDWHYTGWTPFAFVVSERREVGPQLLILSVGAAESVDHGLALWKDISVTEPSPEVPVAQQPPQPAGGPSAPGVPKPRPRPPPVITQSGPVPTAPPPAVQPAPQPASPPIAAAPPPARPPAPPPAGAVPTGPQAPAGEGPFAGIAGLPRIELKQWTPKPPVEASPQPPRAPPQTAAIPSQTAAPPGTPPRPPRVAVPPPVPTTPSGSVVLQISPHEAKCMRGLGASLAWDHRYVDRSGRQPVVVDEPRILRDLQLFAASKEAWVSEGVRACARRMLTILRRPDLPPADRRRLLEDFVRGYRAAWS